MAPKKTSRELPSHQSRQTMGSALSTPNLQLSTKAFSDSLEKPTSRHEANAGIADLEGEIRSRERMLEALDAKMETAPEELRALVCEKDRELEEMRNKVADLTAKLAVPAAESLSAKEKSIVALQEEKIKLLQELQTQEDEMEERRKRIRDLEKELADEKENGELVQEALSEECEALTSQLKLKDEQTKSGKQDILQLSKIVSDMSRMNSQLNEKILAMNKEIEQLNVRCYTAEAMARHTEEIENGYEELRKQYLKVQERRAADEAGESSLASLSQKNRELTAEILNLTQETRRLTTTAAEKTERVAELEKEKVAIRREYEDAIGRLQERAGATQSSFEKMRVKLDFLGEMLLAKDTELQKSTVRLLSLERRLSHLKSDRKSKEASEAAYEARIHELKHQLLKMKSERVSQESSVEAREKRLRLTAARLKAVMEEMWKKDATIAKLRKALAAEESRRKTEREPSAQLRTQVADSLSNASEEVERRDSEIKLLRDMLRSTQMQLRTKESEAVRLKRKYESDPVREGRYMSSPEREPSMERLTLKLDSEVKKVEELVELRIEAEGSGNITEETVRQVLLVEEIPRETEKLLEIIDRKIEEIVKTLEKWAFRKLPNGVSGKMLAGRAKSSLLSSLREDSTVTISEILQKLTDMSVNSESRNRH